MSGSPGTKKIREKSLNMNMLGQERVRNQLRRITAELVGTTWLLCLTFHSDGRPK